MGTRSIGRLSALRFARLREAGRYCDGGGLYLQISRGGSRSWIFRYQLGGRKRDMGLGSADIIGLADARDFAGQCRALIARDIDPIEERSRKKVAAALEEASAITFEECARGLIQSKQSGWRNLKHRQQWSRSLETHAFPVLGKLPVGAINTNLILKVLEPIWSTKTQTASRVRERIEAVLDAAKAKGLRHGENPAAWRGHLDSLLPSPTKISKVRHHPALAYTEITGFVVALKDERSLAARALELLILTASRSGEVLGARWEEFDLTNATWTIPATRIKTGKEHKVPLSQPAVNLLEDLQRNQINCYVFPGKKYNKPLCHLALSKVLVRLKRNDITAHGFRSTFRDWAAEQTNFSREVAEMALAHAIQNKTEAAYRRGGLYEKRSRLMAAWAGYCCPSRKNCSVVPLFKHQGSDQEDQQRLLEKKALG